MILSVRDMLLPCLEVVHCELGSAEMNFLWTRQLLLETTLSSWKNLLCFRHKLSGSITSGVMSHLKESNMGVGGASKRMEEAQPKSLQKQDGLSSHQSSRSSFFGGVGFVKNFLLKFSHDEQNLGRTVLAGVVLLSYFCGGFV